MQIKDRYKDTCSAIFTADRYSYFLLSSTFFQVQMLLRGHTSVFMLSGHIFVFMLSGHTSVFMLSSTLSNIESPLKGAIQQEDGYGKKIASFGRYSLKG
jgi:hypothetical protein